VRSFWDRYIEKLHESGVKRLFDRWFVLRAEQYVSAHPGRKPRDHQPRDVTRYLAETGRSCDMKDWQFRQVVAAIQKLFELVGVDWFDEVDWNHWRDSARHLEETNPTVARDYVERQALPDAGPTTVDALRRTHAALLDEVRAAIRRRGFSIKTEQTYLHWTLHFLAFFGGPDPRAAQASDIARFLDNLAVHRKFSGSTQNLALNALVFLYREALGRSDLSIGEFTRAKRPQHVPTVLTQAEVALLLQQLAGTQHLMASLMYGTGMRLMECSRLRIQDIDFGYGQITVRNAKGSKDRVVPLPEKAASALSGHLERVKTLHEADLAEGFGEVYLPDALARKYPHAAKDWRWQYVFPSARLSADPRSGAVRRHHLHENGLQKAVKLAAERAHIAKRVGTHTLRHSFATHLLQAGYDIRTLQELLGHSDVSTTMILRRRSGQVNTHVLNKGGKGVQSPLDRLA
jgi:integron integrase